MNRLKKKENIVRRGLYMYFKPQRHKRCNIAAMNNNQFETGYGCRISCRRCRSCSSDLSLSLLMLWKTSLFVWELQIDFHTQTFCTCQLYVAAL